MKIIQSIFIIVLITNVGCASINQLKKSRYFNFDGAKLMKPLDSDLKKSLQVERKQRQYGHLSYDFFKIQQTPNYDSTTFITDVNNILKQRFEDFGLDSIKGDFKEYIFISDTVENSKRKMFSYSGKYYWTQSKTISFRYFEAIYKIDKKPIITIGTYNHLKF
jgi:hypothetical protein